jgi:peptide-methionine (S)-S-oxide reductase
MSGVVRTRVGYAGGTTPQPTYRDMGDHTETVQIDYDPAKITYAELLEAFWSGHDSTRRSWSRQYASIILVHTDEQRRLAEETKARLARKLGSTVHTEIVRFLGFTLAENYHQKHSLQQFPEFEEELRKIYPAPADFIASTAVARVNGYLGGEGAYAALVPDLERLGLSPARREDLRELVRRHKGGAACPLPDRSGQ